MKISIVLGPFQAMPPAATGAVEKVWFGLAERFAARGHEVTLIGKGASDAGATGLRIIGLRGFRSTATLALNLCKDLAYAMQVAPRIPPSDVIVTNTFWLPAWLGSRAAVVVHVARFPKGQMRLYRKAAVLHTVSTAVADAIKAEAPALAEKVHVIGYPVDLRTFTAGATSREPLVLYVGRVHPEKGLDILIDAFRDVARQVPGARLQIVGPAAVARGGGGESYRRRLATAAADLDVRFVDAISDPRVLARVYREAACFCYPSIAEKGETFGMSILEAMACGVPCVVSDLRCFKDFAIHGETAVAFDHRAGNAAELLAQALVSVLADTDRAERLARSGRERAQEFDIDRLADRYLAMFAGAHGA